MVDRARIRAFEDTEKYTNCDGFAAHPLRLVGASRARFSYSDR